jgi:ketosteroid isomerase-like protein
MSERNVALVRSFQDRFSKGDVDYVLSILADDIVVHEAPNVPYPGDHRGKDGFKKLAAAFGQVWDRKRLVDLDVMPAGPDRVVLAARSDVVAKPTGTSLMLRVIEIYTIRDGKIAEILVHYWDTAEMTAATNGIKVLEAPAA